MSAALEVSGLVVDLDGRIVLAGVDVQVPAGAVTAVVGPNGAGKSTFLRTVVGAARSRAGTTLLDGDDVERLGRRERARRMAFVEQDAHAEVAMDVLDVALLGRTPHRARWATDSPDDVTLARDALARVGADTLVGRDIATLSGGERQRVHLARGLTQQPVLMLLDEPTNHLDVSAQLAVLGLARELASSGVTVLAALHDLNHALRYCDHVLVLDTGRVAGSGPPAEVLTEELVSRVYGVRARRATVDERDLLLFDPV